MSVSQGTTEIIVGDCREVMAGLPEQHFHCCVTSPPYFGLRDYGVDGQIGLEPTPDEFVAAMVDVFRSVWRVLRDDGVLFLNLGDSYAASGKDRTIEQATARSTLQGSMHTQSGILKQQNKIVAGLKAKDLMGMPWRVAFALQADGWYLRDAIIWHKPSPMPGSQRDRCTSSYEYIFQLAKKPRYFFDLQAIKEPCRTGDRGSSFVNGKTNATHPNVGQGPRFGGSKAAGYGSRAYSGNEYEATITAAPRNVLTPVWDLEDARSLLDWLNRPTERSNIWKISSEGFSDAHFATYPKALPLKCIKAATSEKGCCPECGAPWERVIEKDRKATRPGNNTKVGRVSDDPDSPYNGQNGSVVGNRDPQRHTTITRTTGWKPGCECNLDSVPCRVLDNFMGAGTTGLAANLIGRDCVGSELNPEYAEMARKRIAKALRPSTFRDMDKAEDAPLFESCTLPESSQ